MGPVPFFSWAHLGRKRPSLALASIGLRLANSRGFAAPSSLDGLFGDAAAVVP